MYVFTWRCSVQRGLVDIPQPRAPIHFSEKIQDGCQINMGTSLLLISTKSFKSNTAWKITVYLTYIKEPGTQNWTTPSVLTVNRLMKLKFRLMSWREKSIPVNFVKNCKLISFGLNIHVLLCSYTELILALLPLGQHQCVLFSEALSGLKGTGGTAETLIS